ncbi:MAG: sporulation membrane protein YtaF [Halanaerobiaceae bacterium]
MDLNYIWPIFILAMAISIDGFSVGITYGIRGIKIGCLPLLLIGSISTISIYLTSLLGSTIAIYIGSETAEKIGSCILIGIGIWLVYSTYSNYNNKNKESSLPEQKLVFSLKIKSLGIIINILREPVCADFDKSGTINYVEATLLGLALALDALGAGLGAGMTGFSGLALPAVIGTVNLCFVGGGFLLGKKIGNVLPEHFELIPGIVIIFMGIINFF